MPFGVELPENFGTPPAEQSDTPAPSESAPAGIPSEDKASNESTSQPKTTQDILDLEKLERFRFAGREWKPKDLHNAYLMREDYTRKTQEVAETRKFADNFAADLRTVQRDPTRFEEFKRLYPQEFVALAQQSLDSLKPVTQSTPENGQPATQDPRLQELYDKVAKWEKSQQEAEIKSLESWINNQFSMLGKKYPFANAEVVNARAEVAARQGTKITEQVLDKLFRANDTEIKKQWDDHYKTKVTKQVEVGRKGRDIGAGGGTPSTEPQRPRTIRQATELALQELASR